MLSLKIASKLESIGKRGKLILIDGSPKFLKTQATKYIPAHFTDVDIQNLLLINACNRVHGLKSDEIKKKVMKQESWETKLKEFETSYLTSKRDQYYISALQAIFYRIKISLTTDKLEFPILQNTPLTIIKPSISNITIENDYGLNKYSRDEIQIQTIDGDHLSILESNQLVDVISS
jgi:fatty acid synthase